MDGAWVCVVRPGTVRLSFRHRMSSTVLLHLQLIDVGVEDSVYESNTRRLVRVLIGELDSDFPDAAFEGGCYSRELVSMGARICDREEMIKRGGEPTFCWSFEANVELLPKRRTLLGRGAVGQKTGGGPRWDGIAAGWLTYTVTSSGDHSVSHQGTRAGGDKLSFTYCCH